MRLRGACRVVVELSPTALVIRFEIAAHALQQLIDAISADKLLIEGVGVERCEAGASQHPIDRGRKNITIYLNPIGIEFDGAFLVGLLQVFFNMLVCEIICTPKRLVYLSDHLNCLIERKRFCRESLPC